MSTTLLRAATQKQRGPTESQIAQLREVGQVGRRPALLHHAVR